MSDEGVHEIQLNGKQLVFLFMAATVVAVAIFLCGVMVGRGVPTRAASASDGLGEEARLDPSSYVPEPPSSQAGTGSDPATPQETLTYPTLLDDPNPPAESLAPAVEPTVGLPALAAPPPPVAPAPSPTPAAPPPATPAPRQTQAAPPPATPAPRQTQAVPPPATPAPSVPSPVAAAPVPALAAVTFPEPPGTGFVVQVAAVRQRGDADTIALRLSAKGYPAFVTTAGANFRVRVGKYNDRREAESVAGRLEREERFTPWITR